MKKLFALILLTTLFISCDNENGIHTITLTSTEGGNVIGGGNVSGGNLCTIEASSIDGYGFKGWYDGDKLITSDEVYSFTPYNDRNLKAVFSTDIVSVRVYTVTPSGDKILNERLNYTKPSSITLTAQSEKEWFFMGWYDIDGNKISSNTAYSISINISDNMKLYKKYQR